MNSADPIRAVQDRIASEWASWRYERLFVKIIDVNQKPILKLAEIPPELDEEIFSVDPLVHDGSANHDAIQLRTKSRHLYAAVSSVVKLGGRDDQRVKVFIALDLSEEDALLDRYRNRLFLVLAIVFLVSLFIGRSLAKAGLRPLEDMIKTTDKIRSSTLHERFFVESLPVELRNLAKTINEMLDRLENSFDRLSRFSSDIAHELRTPLNNLKGEIEVTLAKPRSELSYQEVFYSALEEVNRLSRMIDSLLFLSKAEDPQTLLQKEEIWIATEIEKIVEFYEPTASEEGIRIEVMDPIQIPILVEKTLFQRAVSNVISNAIHYNHPGGLITIKTLAHPNSVSIQVEDTGVGMSKESLERVFDRFFRADTSRTTNKLGGFGLGLPISKSILQLHGGTIEIESELNRGTTVTMTFPR
jgi:two-component system heavy metal sensor histidine kinase CusS